VRKTSSGGKTTSSRLQAVTNPLDVASAGGAGRSDGHGWSDGGELVERQLEMGGGGGGGGGGGEEEGVTSTTYVPSFKRVSLYLLSPPSGLVFTDSVSCSRDLLVTLTSSLSSLWTESHLQII